MSRLVLGPFNRVEGDLEVQLEIEAGRVREARVHAPMFRGFESMLVGRDPMDALTIVPRICGICSVSQSMASAMALASAAGLVPVRNGQIASNLMLACENLADHLTHFYVFFMPDFARPVYAQRPWHAQACRRFGAIAGAAGGPGAHSLALLAVRARWLALMGTLGGKWPHTGSVLPGGSSRALEPSECIRMLARVREMREFLERTLFGTPLEAFATLEQPAALQGWREQAQGSDLALFLDIIDDLQLNRLGHGPGRYLSYGAYAQGESGHTLRPGVWEADSAQVNALDAHGISEDSRHAWLTDAALGRPLHPREGLTQPLPDKAGAYTWNKAPRLHGKVMETGAIARQMVDGQPLVRSLVQEHGGCVGTRVLARLMEVARLIGWVEKWFAQLTPGAPFHQAQKLPDEASGAGLTEAARGALGHWVRIEKARIASYQIIAPTTWNFSPRDSAGQAGALESALVGTAVDNPMEQPGQCVAVQHIVRSFDPCMVCTVH
jgi:hydrogenase large subunit